MKRVIIVAIIACIVILGCSIYKASVVKEPMTADEAVRVTNEYIESLKKEIEEKIELKTEKEKELNDLKLIKTEKETELKKETEALDKLDSTSTDTDVIGLIKGHNLNMSKLFLEIQSLSDKINTLENLITGIPLEIQRLETEIERRSNSQSYYQDLPQTIPDDETNDSIAFVQDESGKMVGLESTGTIGGSPTYYTPGSYTFGASTYVPSYEDSVLLSKTTGRYSAADYLNESSLMKGSCEYYKDQPAKLEQACLNVDKKNCSSMSCCVLLGGSKCVSGDENGPVDTRNYGDKLVKNKDYYYHSGKCYGNCK